jgi:hypothetical protein
VNGPSIAIEAVHDFEPLEAAAVVLAPLLLAAPLLLLLLLLLPQPAATSAVRARAAKPVRAFTVVDLLLRVILIVVHDSRGGVPG